MYLTKAEYKSARVTVGESLHVRRFPFLVTAVALAWLQPCRCAFCYPLYQVFFLLVVITFEGQRFLWAKCKNIHSLRSVLLSINSKKIHSTFNPCSIRRTSEPAIRRRSTSPWCVVNTPHFSFSHGPIIPLTNDAIF